MNNFLEALKQLPFWLAAVIFLAENLLIMFSVIICGNLLQKKSCRLMFSYTKKEWRIALLTCFLNTVVTYAGFWLWERGLIQISYHFSSRIFIDTLFLFLSMDLLMYLFHIIIHKTFLYKKLHGLHHEAVNPEPIDLFVLHPLETLGFGALWLMLLLLFKLNIYGIIIYLIINVLFGMIGHLGMEPVPLKIRELPVIKYLGTSSFHHWHHKDEQSNFGFYTSLWDRIFGTFRKTE